MHRVGCYTPHNFTPQQNVCHRRFIPLAFNGTDPDKQHTGHEVHTTGVQWRLTLPISNTQGTSNIKLVTDKNEFCWQAKLSPQQAAHGAVSFPTQSQHQKYNLWTSLPQGCAPTTCPPSIGSIPTTHAHPPSKRQQNTAQPQHPRCQRETRGKFIPHPGHASST